MSLNQCNDSRTVEVIPHNPTWRITFIEDSKQIALAMGENVVTIHHIGSTAIPSIYAKPIIDFLIEVKDIAKVDDQNLAMAVLGYEAMGEFGIRDRRFFLKNSAAGKRTHHLHTFEAKSPEIKRHLAFRDYIIAHPEVAQKYSELKRELAKKYPEDIQGYMKGKNGFIREVEKTALEWQNLKFIYSNLSTLTNES